LAKLIIVIRANGSQGGGIVRHFLEDHNWNLRGVTQNTTSTSANANANALAILGAEMIFADIPVLETLLEAMKVCPLHSLLSSFTITRVKYPTPYSP
jgi:hypothetical protein